MTTTTTGTDVDAASMHAELEQEIIRLKLELAEAKTLNEHTRKERDDASHELSEAVQVNIRIMRERDQLRAELEDARSQIDDLAVEITNLRFNSFKLSHDMDLFQRENNELERRNRYLEEQKSDSQIGVRSSSGVGDDTISTSIAEEQTLCSHGSSSSSVPRKDSARDSHGSVPSLTCSRTSQSSGIGGGVRPDFGKMESSSKLMNGFTASDIFGAIEDGCLGLGSPSEPIKRLSHQNSRRSLDLSEGVPTKHG